MNSGFVGFIKIYTRYFRLFLDLLERIPNIYMTREPRDTRIRDTRCFPGPYPSRISGEHCTTRINSSNVVIIKGPRNWSDFL